MKTLVAEDNRASRILLEKILTLKGYEVLSAENGIDALELYKKNDIDMVFVDWMMPKLDGIKLCKEIRNYESETGRQSNIFMVTGKGGELNMLTALEAGADDFIMKPYDHITLESRIQKVNRIKNGLTFNAIQVLKDEHSFLQRMATVLEKIAGGMKGAPIPQKILNWCGSTPLLFVSEVHHKKEDFFIRTFLENVIMEHGEAPKTRIFSRSSLKLIEEEHKELDRRLKELQKNIKLYSNVGSGSEIILKNEIEMYVNLLRKHMNREDKYLFPISQKYLSEEDMGKLLVKFTEVEEKIGIQKLDKYGKQMIRLEELLNKKT